MQAWGAPAATVTVLTMSAGGSAVASGGSITAGAVLTLTAKVTAGATGVTTGQVSFCDAAAAYCSDIHRLGTAQLTSAGIATLKFIPGIGSHSYKAVFSGTPNGSLKTAGSTSSNAAVTVPGTFPTTTTIAATGNPGNYTLTATITAPVNGSSLPGPSGVVSFLDTSQGNASLGSAETGSGTIALSFQNSSNPAVNDLPYSTVTADFNNDGIPDLAIANYTSDNITVLLGNGDGTFHEAPNSPIMVTFDPRSLVVSDFNGDGNADLAMVNSYYSGVATILLGDGNGTFTEAPNSPIAIGGAFQIIAGTVTGDFNGDGIPDLGVTNTDNVESDPGTLTVLLGKGDGTFTQAPNSPMMVGAEPIRLASGDFDRDGNLDLAIANFDGNNVSILRGAGDGTFSAAAVSPIQVGTAPSDIVVDDFNGDGLDDLAVLISNFPGAQPGYIQILLGIGDGTFKAVSATASTGTDPQSLVAGDFNQDSKVDLAALNEDGPVSFLLGAGDGTFSEASTSPIQAGDFPDSAAVGDFNGDGISDIAVTDSGYNITHVFLSQLTQSAIVSATNISPSGVGTHQVEATYPGDNLYTASASSTIALQGVANPTLALTVPAVTIAVGSKTATASVTVTPGGGFTGNVMLTAAVTSSPAGAIDPPSVSITSPNPVSITGAGAATATLTITTTSSGNTALARPTNHDAWRSLGVATFACVLFWLGPSRLRRSWAMLTILVAFALIAGLITGCGGNGSNGNPGTTVGTYIVTITGSAGAIHASTTVSVKVE